MRRVLTLLVIFATIAAVAVRAEDDSDYTKWMKQADKRNGSLRKELKAGSSEAAAADANQLAGIFDQIGQFWQKRNADDAVKFAADAAAGFRQVAGLATSRKFDEASAAQKSTEAQCSDCHRAHRGISLHGWKIK